MIYAGNVIDCTLGVTFGLSTLAAASVGALVSNSCGVVFGNTLEAIFSAIGLPRADLSSAQRQLPIIQRITFAASVVGIVLGGLLGLLNLLLIDTNKSSSLKLQAWQEGQDGDEATNKTLSFVIEASNAVRPDATCLTVWGPDSNGLLASMTAALSTMGCNILEIHATRPQQTKPNNLTKAEEKEKEKDDNDDDDDDDDDEMVDQPILKVPSIHDVFYVINRETGQAFEYEELETLAQGLLEATRTPIHHIQAAMHELEHKNTFLQDRVQKLERLLYKKQISMVINKGEPIQHRAKTTTINSNSNNNNTTTP
jgi:hypothetical protein